MAANDGIWGPKSQAAFDAKVANNLPARITIAVDIGDATYGGEINKL